MSVWRRSRLSQTAELRSDTVHGRRAEAGVGGRSNTQRN